MKKVLVAGSTGYLGGFVIRELKAQGHHVRALARSPEKLDPVRGLVDEVVRAEVTRPETLKGVCAGVDAVFSSVGITRQKDGLTFRDVDFQGNLNLLESALGAGVGKFVYVSVFNGPGLTHLEIVKAHEDFARCLKESGMDYTILRPTGYFSDLGAILEMAQKGRVYLVGQGANRTNPIHGADLAVGCAQALEAGEAEIDLGGPEIMTYRRMAEMAFEALGHRPRITSIPVWTMKAMNGVVKLFNRHQGELLAFFTEMMSREVVAPRTGGLTLGDHFRGLAAGS